MYKRQTLGITTTNALVVARNIIREKTEVRVPIMVQLLVLLLVLVIEMKAIGVATRRPAGLRLVQRLHSSRYLPHASCSVVQARMQQENRNDPLAVDRSRSNDLYRQASAFLLRGRSDGRSDQG